MGRTYGEFLLVFSLERESEEGGKLCIRRLFTILNVAVLVLGRGTVARHTKPKRAGIKAEAASG